MSGHDSKPWWQSKAIWGGILAIGAAVAGGFGYTVDAGTQAETQETIVGIVSAVGGLLAIYGRIKASKGIGK